MIHQKHGYGIGNFVTMTSAIRSMMTPVTVFFDDKAIEELYADSLHIQVAHKLKDPINRSGLPPRRENESDYHAWCRAFNVPFSQPFVPTPPCDIYVPKNAVAVFHGCAGTIYREKKDVGSNIRECWVKQILDDGNIPFFLGSESDIDNYWSYDNIDFTVGTNLLGRLTLKQTVGVLARCHSFISNDTGLYHVAAALGLPGTVYWKDTDMVKNRAPSERIKHYGLSQSNPSRY